MIIEEPQIETVRIEKEGNGNMINVKNCKDFRKALTTLIGHQTKRSNIELMMYTRGILDLYNKFHPKKDITTHATQWQGKSSMEIITEVDSITIIKYQKKDKDSEPSEVKIVVDREELKAIIDAIKLNYNKQPIETKEIAKEYCLRLNLRETNKGVNLFAKGTNFWDTFFSWRSRHNRLTTILNALDNLGLIKYVGGKITVIEKKLSIQNVLPLE